MTRESKIDMLRIIAGSCELNIAHLANLISNASTREEVVVCREILQAQNLLVMAIDHVESVREKMLALPNPPA